VLSVAAQHCAAAQGALALQVQRQILPVRAQQANLDSASSTSSSSSVTN
jgi:hypothetical protein